jgi:glycerophosphoryl diester phosphodiesterase
MLIYAHRGASIDFTEGSRAAYLGALAQGADGFECDVRLTKDKQIICYHDSDTKRLSNVDLKIAKSSYEELKVKVDPYRLDELLELAISNKKDLVIELKHPVSTGALIEKHVHKLLKSRQAEIQSSGIQISLISFSYFATLRNLKSGYQAGYLVKNSNLIRFNPAPVIALSIEILRQNPGVVEDQHKRGKKVFIWTVNEAADLDLCSKVGVDAVITDKPEQARKLLGYS